MKPDDLMKAIEDIDDRFVEESAYGFRRKSNIPWGLIATAACFCLVVGAAIFMHNAGLMPYQHGPGTTTTQPDPSTGTQPSYEDTVTPTGYATLDEAIIDVYYNKFLKEEVGVMIAGGWVKDESEVRSSVTVTHIASYGNVYAVFMGDNVFGYSQAFRREEVGGLTFEFSSGQPLMIYRDYDITQLADAYAQGWLTDDQLADLQTHFELEWYTEPTDPTQPTVPEDTIGPPLQDSQLSWYGRVLAHEYDRPENILLGRIFAGGFPEESKELTEQEKTLLKENGDRTVLRLPVERINAALQEYYGITVEDLNDAPTGLPGFMYLAETNCYYLIGSNFKPAQDVVIGKTEVLQDGTVLTEYTKDGSVDIYIFAMREARPGTFHILFNRKGTIDEQTGKADELKKLNALFADFNSRYNWAAGQFYQSPENLKLLHYFYGGFKGESQRPTDAEWKELEGRPGFNINYDLFRLPVDKINADLQKHFGITLDDLSHESFDGLVYLQSTNCYYFMGTGVNGCADGFQATNVQTQPDGTLLVTYTVQSNSAIYRKSTCQMGLKAVGDGYQILYNRVLEPAEYIKKGMIYNEVARVLGAQGKPTGDASLAYRWELPDGKYMIITFAPKREEISHIDPNNLVVIDISIANID